MNIIDVGLKFSGALTSRKETTALILHHAAAEHCTVEQVHSWHLGNGWVGIGYHLFIRKDGSVYRGRPIDKVGAHASGHNAYSVGICFEGDYQKETEMPEVQKQAGKEAVTYILQQYPSIRKVLKHKDVNSTSCPGLYFPFDEISVGVNASITVEDVPKTEQIQTNELITGYGSDPAAFIYAINAASSEKDKIKALQIALTLDGSAVTVDGILGTQTEAALKKHTLRVGSRGHLVVYVQKLLGADIDAVYGLKTAALVKAWQAREGKAADSIVGVKTYRGLALDSE